MEALHLVTITPTEYDGAFSYPLKGFRPDIQKASNATPPYTTISRHYIKRIEVESNASDDYTKLVEFADKNWAHLPALNIRVLPRIYIDWDSKSGNEYWSADILQRIGLQSEGPNLWRTQLVKDRLVAFVHKMGQTWNNDPSIAWIQTGLVGYCGEQENPVNINDQYTDNMIDVIRELHAIGFGGIANYDLTGDYKTNLDIVKANADKMQKEFGYRFLLTEFNCSSWTSEDRTLALNFKVKNIGSAPFYELWPVAVVLIDEASKELVWKEVLTNIDFSSW